MNGLLLLCLIAIPSSAHAMAEVVQVVGTVLLFVPGFQPLGAILLLGSAIYGAEQARKKARREAERQRQAHNDGLQERTLTRVATDAPHRTVYGRARVGSDIVGIFAAGAREEFKYLVCVHAAHECDGIEEIWVGNRELGLLVVGGTNEGDVTGGDYFYQSTVSVNAEPQIGTVFNLAHIPVAGSLRVTYLSNGQKFSSNPVSVVGTLVTMSVSRNYLCHYDYLEPRSRVRVTMNALGTPGHLGTPTDPADAALMAALPGVWPSTAVLRGYCYTVVRLDLDWQEFQSGIPPIEVLLRGKKLYDPRNGLTVWSANPALAIYDYLTGENCGVAVADLPLADYITAANVCDEDIGAGVKRYTINGTVNADQDPRKTLESLAQCMAGALVGTTWQCQAGKYVAPVMALDQSDIVGALQVAGGTPDADLYNGVRGQYIGPENSYAMTDVKPWQNTVYVAADGRQLWTDMDFPFTDSAQRIHNLARIFCEDQRAGFTLKADFSLKTWSLKVGQRVTFTSTFLGQTAKIYRVTDKRFGRDQAVELTLKEDAAAIWDLADAVTVDATPNTNLPNPLLVGVPGSVAAVEELYQTTGSAGVRSKVTLSWGAPAGAVMDYEVAYKSYTSGLWLEPTSVRGTLTELVDLTPGAYDFRVRARNLFGNRGEYSAILTFNVYGLLAVPAAVANFNVVAMNGVALATWNKTPDLDVRIGGRVSVRHCPLLTGATWEQSVGLEEFNGDAASGLVSLAAGTYFAKFVDSTGHYSDAATAFVVNAALLTGWTTVATSTQDPLFAGVKTGTVVLSGQLKLDVDALGVLPSGEYAFDAPLDMAVVASRRFHASLQTVMFDTGDLVDARTAVDGWPSVDGGLINSCDATVLASVSADNIIYGPWTEFMVADFNCRYAKFKVRLSSVVNTHNIAVTALAVSAKVAA